MNNKAVSLSLAMAVLAVFFVQSYVTSLEEEQKKKFGTEVLVLRAKQNIKEMDTLDETMLETVPVPLSFREPGAVSWETKEVTKEVANDRKALIGSVAMVPIKKGEQITFNKISEPGVRTGLSPQVTPGRRALSIPITDNTAVTKLVKPGDRVDIMATIDGGGSKDNRMVKTVLQDVVILATGKNVANNSPRTIEKDPFGGKDKIRSLAEDTTFGTVTIEVTPEQAQTLVLLLNDGPLTLALRNNDDNDHPQINPTIYMDILGPDAGKLRLPTGRK
jgi:pilus assembly protein CpaB